MFSSPSRVENFAQFFAIISMIIFVIFLILFFVDLITWGTADPINQWGYSFEPRYKPLDFSWLIASIAPAASAFNLFVIKKILEYLRGILFFTKKN